MHTPQCTHTNTTTARHSARMCGFSAQAINPVLGYTIHTHTRTHTCHTPQWVHKRHTPQCAHTLHTPQCAQVWIFRHTIKSVAHTHTHTHADTHMHTPHGHTNDTHRSARTHDTHRSARTHDTHRSARTCGFFTPANNSVAQFTHTHTRTHTCTHRSARTHDTHRSARHTRHTPQCAQVWIFRSGK